MYSLDASFIDALLTPEVNSERAEAWAVTADAAWRSVRELSLKSPARCRSRSGPVP